MDSANRIEPDHVSDIKNMFKEIEAFKYSPSEHLVLIKMIKPVFGMLKLYAQQNTNQKLTAEISAFGIRVVVDDSISCQVKFVYADGSEKCEDFFDVATVPVFDYILKVSEVK